METTKKEPKKRYCYNPAGFDGFDVRKIDDLEYTVEISCYFLIKWKDDRLVLSDEIMKARQSSNNHNSGGGSSLHQPLNRSRITNTEMLTTAPEEQWFPVDLEFVEKVSPKKLKNTKEKLAAITTCCFSDVTHIKNVSKMYTIEFTANS